MIKKLIDAYGARLELTIAIFLGSRLAAMSAAKAANTLKEALP
ncbi:MAG: hypothetical protein ABIV07_00030 [Polaromonas sp.]